MSHSIVRLPYHGVGSGAALSNGLRCTSDGLMLPLLDISSAGDPQPLAHPFDAPLQLSLAVAVTVKRVTVAPWTPVSWQPGGEELGCS